MPSREQEAELLREYEEELAKARENVESLTPIVEGLRRRVGANTEPDSEVRDQERGSRSLRATVARSRARRERSDEPWEPVEGQQEIELPKAELPTYRGRVTLTSFLRTIAIDHEPVDTDTIVARVANASPFRNSPPARNTILTRLNELANTGKLIKLEDGRYVQPQDSQASGNPGMDAGSPRDRGAETTEDAS